VCCTLLLTLLLQVRTVSLTIGVPFSISHGNVAACRIEAAAAPAPLPPGAAVLLLPPSTLLLRLPVALLLQVRTVSLTMGAPFLSHMATMSGTGLLIARHGPLLASAVLLPPGAAVLELLPYKWEWRDVSSLYHNMTQSTGYIHHWAWRPLDAKFCR
jgi:hypothetical protein